MPIALSISAALIVTPLTSATASLFAGVWLMHASDTKSVRLQRIAVG